MLGNFFMPYVLKIIVYFRLNSLGSWTTVLHEFKLLEGHVHYNTHPVMVLSSLYAGELVSI